MGWRKVAIQRLIGILTTKGVAMKYLILAAALFAGAAVARDVYVQPHTRSDGTYVQGHFRTAPDSTPFNNYSTQGNVNPYTAQPGTVNPYHQQSQPVQPAYPPSRGNNSTCLYGQRC